MPQSGNVPSKLVQLKHITDRGLGAKPKFLGTFCNISEKKSLFKTSNQISHLLRVIQKIKFIQFKSHNSSSPSNPQVTHRSSPKLVVIK